MATVLADSAEKVNAWGKLLRDIGVPVVMLGVMCFAMYQVALFIGNNVLMPTLQDNKQLVANQVEANKALLTSLNEITNNIRQQTESNAENSRALVAMALDIKAIRISTETTAAEVPKFTDTAKQNQAILIEHKQILESLKDK